MLYGNQNNVHGMPTRQFKYRTLPFKIGVAFLKVAALSFTLGIGYPDWDNDKDGLWLLSFNGTYYRNTVIADTEWLNAIRAMECIGLICVWLSVFVELSQDVFTKCYAPTENRAAEILASIAGGFGLLGAIMFGSRRPSLLGIGDVKLSSFGNLIDILIILEKDKRQGPSGVLPTMPGHSADGLSIFPGYTGLGWAFILTTVSCILILISAVVMAFSRRSPSSGTYGKISPIFGALQPAMQPWSAQQGMYPQGQGFPMQEMRQGPFSNAAQTPGGAGQPDYYVMNQGVMVPVFKQPPQQGFGSTPALTRQYSAPDLERYVGLPSAANRASVMSDGMSRGNRGPERYRPEPPGRRSTYSGHDFSDPWSAY